MSARIHAAAIVLLTAACASGGEAIDRGMTARAIDGGRAYLSWRLLESDPAEAAFHVYRESNGAAARRLTDSPITKTTDFVDETAPKGPCVYRLRRVVAGQEEPGEEATAACSGEPADVLRTIRLAGPHTFQKVGIADLDGDRHFDFVIKTPNENIDPYEQYWKPSPGTYALEAYRHDGKPLWRHDLGWAIEQGIWYSPYLVFDLDGDGRAEVAAKTGPGDPRGADGRVRTGPEHVTILDGATGQPITQVDWPSRELFGSPPAYNYASRNQLGVAFLDGATPCLLVGRGTYNRMVLVAYRLADRKLQEVWRWDNEGADRKYWGQGAHWMHAADLDGDGRDEVVLGSVVLDDDGKPLWSTGLGHPDHVYIGDLDPGRPGLEIYFGIERASKANGMCMVDAATGKILWGHARPTRHVHSSGLSSDLDARHAGSECYAGERDLPEDRWLYDCKGQPLDRKNIESLAPRAVYWDADRQRELLQGGRIADFDGPRLEPAIKGSVIAVADILGDWREEIITSTPGELRIYATTIPAADRRACLLQDHLYRMDVAHAAMGYYQVPMTSYDLESRSR